MSRYRRTHTAGATYFFTVVTYHRQAILCEPEVQTALRNAIETVRKKWPFTIEAWVLLPDHLHCIWTLPMDNADNATRWGRIKRRVSLACGASHRRPDWLTASKRSHRESTIWQRRYWEHQILDDRDFARHMDYVHYNPVKHGLCESVAAWPFSTFHRHAAQGDYSLDWGGNLDAMEGIVRGE